jgi:hypothetical protein
VIGSDTLTQLFSTYDFLIKYDSLGNILWTRNEAIDYFEIDLQGNYIIGRDNYYIRKFDDAGGIIWTAHSSKNLRAMAIDGLGNIYAPTNGSQLNKYANSDGHLIWQKPLQPNNIDKIAADSLGNVVTACWTVDSTRNHPAIIDKYNINGDFISKIIWGRRIDPTKDNLLYVYELVYDHGIVYFTGQWGTQDSSKASVVFNRDTLTSKGNYDVIFISTSDQLLGIPSAYIISNPELSCYPNPFTNNFKVRFPFTKEDELRVFNIYGEAILNLKFNIGNDVEINTDDWSLGIYILEVFCTDKRYSYKLIKK